MLKKMMFAAALLALSLGSLAAEVEAKTNFNLYLGVPYYGYQVHPHYRYYNGRGWYDPRVYPYVAPGRMSCNEARWVLKDRGYYNVQTRDCVGRVYSFVGFRKGYRYILYVNSYTGEFWRG